MTEDVFKLRGKNALVIGGGAGIGERTSIRLAEAGCNIAVGDMAQERGDAAAQMLRQYGVEAHAIIGDIVDPEQVVRMVREADEVLGGIDVLVTIVGATKTGSMLTMDVDTWDHDQRLNLRHVFLLNREVAKTMIARGRGGSMTCVTSVSGVQAAPNHGAYGAAKAGLIHLVKTMAVEWAQYGIRVNAVGPGAITTPRIPDTPERVAELANSNVPMRRLGAADEIAKAILFMTSDLSSYITGQNLMVDGGWTAANVKNSAQRGAFADLADGKPLGIER